MSDSQPEDGTVAALRAVTASLTARALAGVPAVGSEPVAAGVRLARTTAMEELRAALAAAQMVEVAALAAERRAAVEVEIATVSRPGVGARRRREEARRRMVAEVGLARRISPWQASQFVAFAEQAPVDLPATFRLLATGRLSERRAGSVFAAVTALEPEQRRQVDAALAPDLPDWSDKRVDQNARAEVYRIDPAGVVERNAYAKEQRRVSVRPAPECMAWLTTLTTMPHAVAVRAQLERDATAALAAGDDRTRAQVMADTLVARVLDPTGGAGAGAGTAGVEPTAGTAWPTGSAVGAAGSAARTPAGAAFTGPVAIELLMSDQTLLGGDGPARFADGEPYPAPLARALAFGDGVAVGVAARSIRRLFTDPAGRLITAETASRQFTAAMRDLIRWRDGLCTTPWCDATIHDIDHDDPHVRGGPTSLVNGRGKCRWCNVTKGDRQPPPPTEPLHTTEPPPTTEPDVAAASYRPRRSHLERRLRRHVDRQSRRAQRRRARVLAAVGGSVVVSDGATWHDAPG